MISSIKIKFRSAIAIILLVLNAMAIKAELAANETNTSEWERVRKIFERYFREPTIEHVCEAFYAIVSGKKMEKPSEEFLKLFDDSGNRYILIREALAGNICAARTIIRLTKLLDEKSKEALIKESSILIRLNPNLFLRACLEEAKASNNGKNVFPVTVLSSTMKPGRRSVYEINSRIKAIRSVKETELASLAQKYIQELENYLDSIGLTKMDTFIKRDPSANNDLSFRIKEAINLVLEIPDADNIKLLIEALPEEQEKIVEVLPAIHPISIFVRPIDKLFEVLVYEMYCGNEYAADILFKNYRLFEEMPACIVFASIGETLIINPGLFVSKLAKYKSYLPSGIVKDLCITLPVFIYSDRRIEFLRRIESLEKINMPENRDLIQYLINLIKEQIKYENKEMH